MTTTVQEIIRGALILVGVLDVGDSIPPELAADGLIFFNDMVASWDGKGVHAGAGPSEITSPSPLEEQHTKGLKNLLAVELAGTYGRAIPTKVSQDASDGWQAIKADFGVVEKLVADDGLQGMPSQRWCW